ncbi:MAG: thiamin phosphate synthase [Candidatus Scalindua rubra]|uniref:Thiamine-phosphate synthase n=1 Tax=Candidatus Scalindua rubra TaxID=1872076 RepID=A0A1E3XAL9_9BACT|nr:MAG: thiamin phosphate synthase [Candidatus Scalindua rubra]
MSIHDEQLQKLDLVLITNRKICEVGLVDIIRQAIEGGVGTIQLREKDLSTKDLYKLAKELREKTKELNANLIINDRADIALAVGADGVHLGWQSLNTNVVRRIIGHNKVIGYSAHNLKEAEKANFDGADYITISPIYDTTHKDYFIKPLGVEEIRKIKEKVDIPVIALGGINENNVKEVLRSGVDGIAVISAILLSKEPKQTTTMLYREIEKYKMKPEDEIFISGHR